MALSMAWLAFSLLPRVTGEECPSTGLRPSPANVVPHSATTWTGSLRLQYHEWNRSSLQLEESDEGILKLAFQSPEGGGSIQVGSSFADLDEYVLRSLRLVMPSEHTFLDRRMPLEVQLWHEPVMNRDLDKLSGDRQKAWQMLQTLHAQILAWHAETKHLEAPSGANASFPNRQTEIDWADRARGRSVKDGEALLAAAEKVQKEIELLDEQVAMMNHRMSRPDFARVVILSVFFLAPHDLDSLLSAGHFVRWLRDAAETLKLKEAKVSPEQQVEVKKKPASDGWRSVSGGAGQQNSRRLGRNSSEVFSFDSLDHHAKQTSKDLRGSLSQAAFTYEGSFPRPPCTPLVRWFLASEALASSAEDLLDLAGILSSDPTCASVAENGASSGGGVPCSSGINPSDGVWWSGPIKATPEVAKKLVATTMATAEMSFAGFSKPKATQLTSELVSSLPWVYVQAACGVLLICSVGMLFITCSMWAQQCCDQ